MAAFYILLGSFSEYRSSHVSLTLLSHLNEIMFAENIELIMEIPVCVSAGVINYFIYHCL